MLGNIIFVITGLVALIWGADRFVHGAAASARNLGVAPLLIGLTIVAFATSAPEILVSVIASLKGQPGLAFGNAIGSNIANIGLVLGCVAIIRPIQLRSATLRREMPALLAVTLLTVSLFLDAYLSRIDGLVMLTGLVIVMIWLARTFGWRSLTGEEMRIEHKPWKSGVSHRYWIGGTLFGLGWGLSGTCPGPIYALLGYGASGAVVVLVAALIGTRTYAAILHKLPH